MSAQPVPDTATRTPHDVLDAAIGAAHAGGRPDLADRLSATRRLLDDTSVTVQVAGGAQQDRTALVAVLLRAGAGRVSFTGDDSGGALGTAVDAVLLVASAAQVIGDAELDRVRALRHRSPRILLALTAIDRHRSWRQVLEANIARLRAAGVTVVPFAVSVEMHRHAVATGDSALVAASGVPALAKHLDDLAEQAALGTARTVAQQVLNALTELEATPADAPRPAPPASAPARSRRTPPDGTGPDRTPTHSTGPDHTGPDHTGPHRTAPHSSRPDRTPPDHTGPHRTGPDYRLDRRPDRGPDRRADRNGPADRGRWQQVLTDGMAAAASDVDFELRSRVRAAVADAERVVEAGDPARNWTDIDTWLRDRLTYEGEQTFALLADRTAEVAAALERELGGAPLRPVHRAPVPDLFGHQPPRDAPTGIRRPLATRSRSLVMSGYGGLMMALILPRFAGVQLPVWVVVGGALGAALLLGGAALSGERKRQLETRRNRAKSLVRNSADGFLLVAGKHTRDTLRRAQQQLRDECAARTASPRDTDRPTRAAPTDGAPPGELDSLRSRALALLGRPA